MFESNEVVTTSGSAWYVLYTRPNHEKSVANIVAGSGGEVFLPLYKSLRRWKDRTKEVSLPLFPSYVFLRGRSDRRPPTPPTSGVHGFVEFGDKPAAVSQKEIEAIRRVINEGVEVEPHPFLHCGDRVRVKSGPLAGIEGILTRKKDLFRLVLSITLLGRSVSVEVISCALERVSGAMIPLPQECAHVGKQPEVEWSMSGSERRAAS
jgi:transcription antitermination factor NusG